MVVLIVEHIRIGGDVIVNCGKSFLFGYFFQRAALPVDKFIAEKIVLRFRRGLNVRAVKNLLRLLAAVVDKFHVNCFVFPSGDESHGFGARHGVGVSRKINLFAVRPSLELIAHPVGRVLDRERAVVVDALLYGRLRSLRLMRKVVHYRIACALEPCVQRHVLCYRLLEVVFNRIRLVYVPPVKSHSLRRRYLRRDSPFSLCRLNGKLLHSRHLVCDGVRRLTGCQAHRKQKQRHQQHCRLLYCLHIFTSVIFIF